MMKLGDLCTVSRGFAGADFWLDHKTGKPTKEFAERLIGIRVERKDILVPQYLFYVMEHLSNSGMFNRLPPSVERVKNIQFEQQ